MAEFCQKYPKTVVFRNMSLYGRARNFERYRLTWKVSLFRYVFWQFRKKKRKKMTEFGQNTLNLSFLKHDHIRNIQYPFGSAFSCFTDTSLFIPCSILIVAPLFFWQTHPHMKGNPRQFFSIRVKSHYETNENQIVFFNINILQKKKVFIFSKPARMFLLI